jgi:D-alanyl-lipoteichoic acid acyltransferase DltB (MBOAT superfamily)
MVFIFWLAFPPKKRWIILLCSSYLFYFTWKPWYAIILLICSVATWWLGIRIAVSGVINDRKKYLAAALIINLGALFFYKYFNFFSETLRSVFSFSGLSYQIPYSNILLPLGISFYTLQALSYVIDVYKERINVEKHIGIFCLYLAFFPKLISGPIERAGNLLPQLNSRNRIDWDNINSGINLFIWCLFKKVVIADRLAMYVDMVFSQPHDYWGWTLIVAAWLFALQIYCDFSAYTDMAIGCGRIFGIELTQNFNFPYFARSIADFWRRWHISLTSWFRDYVYFPLGGNRVTKGQWAFNILIVFLLSGLWHGANWTFMFWGLLHGSFYLIGKITRSSREKLCESLSLKGNFLNFLQIIITFNLVSIAWVFFRAENINEALYIISNMFVNITWPLNMMASQFSTYLTFLLAILFIAMEIIRYIDIGLGYKYSRAIPPVFKYSAYVAVLIMISLLGVSSNKFIYFHF